MKRRSGRSFLEHVSRFPGRSCQMNTTNLALLLVESAAGRRRAGEKGREDAKAADEHGGRAQGMTSRAAVYLARQVIVVSDRQMRALRPIETARV